MSLILWGGCGETLQKPQAEQVYINGHILTLEEAFPEMEAMAVGGGRILSIGTTEELKKLHPQAEVVDLAGKTVIFSPWARAFWSSILKV